jgi:hypothetical protein
VLWLEPNGKAPAPPYELRAGSRLVATWYYIGIEVYRLPAEELIARGLVGLLPVVPFTRDGRDLAVVERAADALRERTAGVERDEFGALFAFFASRTFGGTIASQLFGRLAVSREILESSPLYQEWMREWTEKGREARARTSVLLALRGRLGELASDLVAAISAADQSTLDALLPQLASITMEEWRARLGLT